MVAVVTNAALTAGATAGLTSTIDEPTAAANGKKLMMTGNWFASTSLNGGAAWNYVDPFTLFPASVGGFCCDQIVLYPDAAPNKIWIWLLQYVSTSSGNNIFRLAISKDASFGNWYYWDFAPSALNSSWKTMWFDYPDLAFSDKNLFVTTNSFIGNAWQRAFVSSVSAGDFWPPEPRWATTGGRRPTMGRCA